MNKISNKELSKLTSMVQNSSYGRVVLTREDGIYLLERYSSGSDFLLKIFPQLTELRKNKDFIFSCLQHFTNDHSDSYLANLCKWFFDKSDKCPVFDFDLLFIPGEFHKDVVFFDGEELMSREKLIDSIEKKFRNGYVLDHSKMKCDRIAYENGDYDSINRYFLPCLVTNDKNEVAVDYFEEGEFASISEQVGITSCSEYTLDFIQTPYLHHILYSMALP